MPEGAQRVTSIASLSAQEVCRLLLKRGLVSPQDMISERFRIIETTRRNRNFKVYTGGSQSFVVKQALDADGVRTVAHEAYVYRLLSERRNSGRGPTLPPFHGYDDGRGALIVGLRRGAHDLSEHSARVARFSEDLARGVGCALAELHTLPDAKQQAAALGDRPPWALHLHRPGVPDYVRMGAGALCVVRIVQQAPELCEQLDALRHGWTSSHMMHGDLKWDNCLVLPRRSEARHRICLIDLEFTRLGDPAWDVGSMFANYLTWWLASFPDLMSVGNSDGLATASFPLERMQPAVRAFWGEYRAGVRIAHGAAYAWLMRATRCAGARLLQTAFETAQFAPQPTRQVVGMLQLASSVVTRPLEAAVQLLGIDLGAVG